MLYFRHHKTSYSSQRVDEFDDTAENPQENPQDYLFNYHNSKLLYSFILMEFNDSIKGDGDRLFDLYRLCLLLTKVEGTLNTAMWFSIWLKFRACCRRSSLIASSGIVFTTRMEELEKKHSLGFKKRTTK